MTSNSKGNAPKSTSLIITTYNKPIPLRITLESVLRQTTAPSEVIVADDGSSEETFDVVRAFRRRARFPVLHTWQPNDGMRLSRNRNNALAIANGEYVVMIDGDLILEEHFLEDHFDLARPGRFVSGRRANLVGATLDALLERGELDDFQPSPMLRDLTKRKYAFRSRALAAIFSKRWRPGAMARGKSVFRLTRFRVIGSNFAYWLDDARRVNGFNELFVGWGPEDKEFAQRLSRAGLELFAVANLCVNYHLNHGSSTRVAREEFIRKYPETLEPDQIRLKNEYGMTRAASEGVPRVEGR